MPGGLRKKHYKLSFDHESQNKVPKITLHRLNQTSSLPEHEETNCLPTNEVLIENMDIEIESISGNESILGFEDDEQRDSSIEEDDTNSEHDSSQFDNDYQQVPVDFNLARGSCEQ